MQGEGGPEGTDLEGRGGDAGTRYSRFRAASWWVSLRSARPRGQVRWLSGAGLGDGAPGMGRGLVHSPSCSYSPTARASTEPSVEASGAAASRSTTSSNEAWLSRPCRTARWSSSLQQRCGSGHVTRWRH